MSIMERNHDTKRLLLYPMTEKFKNELDPLHADKEVMALVGGAYSQAVSHQKTQESAAHWITHGFGLWCWFDKQSGEFVGRGGLRNQQLDNGQRITEIAYMVHKRFWKQGFATEVAQYCLEVGFNQLNLKEIVAITTLENTSSQRVMEKAGLIFEKELVLFRRIPHLIAKCVRVSSQDI
jgi:ribosomal-protein-alanine N-acetyltransferase